MYGAARTAPHRLTSTIRRKRRGCAAEAIGESFARAWSGCCGAGRRRAAMRLSGAGWGQWSATRTASSMPGQGGMVTMTKRQRLRSRDCGTGSQVPSGIECAVCGRQRHDLLALALAAPQLARAREDVPELVDGAVGDGQRHARPGGRVQWTMLPPGTCGRKRISEPSGARTSWRSAGRPVAKDGHGGSWSARRSTRR